MILPFLYVDNSPESQEAEEALQKAGISYQRHVIDDPKEDGKPVPRLWTNEGCFDSVSSIRWYANAYGKK